MMNDWIAEYLEAQRRALDSLKPDQLSDLIRLLKKANEEDRHIYVCGNGGNAANASHFVTDLGKNASEAMPKPFRVMTLNDNISWVTAIGNDYAYEDVYLRQLYNYGRPGDWLIVSSVSGNSPNLVKVMEWAKQNGMIGLALVGAKRGKLAELADHVVMIEDTHYGRVEDVQMHVLHILCYAFAENVVQQETGA